MMQIYLPSDLDLSLLFSRLLYPPVPANFSSYSVLALRKSSFKPDLLFCKCSDSISYFLSFYIILHIVNVLFLTLHLLQPEADNVNFHFIAFVNVNGQLYEFGKMIASSKSIVSCFMLYISNNPVDV